MAAPMSARNCRSLRQTNTINITFNTFLGRHTRKCGLESNAYLHYRGMQLCPSGTFCKSICTSSMQRRMTVYCIPASQRSRRHLPTCSLISTHSLNVSESSKTLRHNSDQAITNCCVLFPYGHFRSRNNYFNFLSKKGTFNSRDGMLFPYSLHSIRAKSDSSSHSHTPSDRVPHSKAEDKDSTTVSSDGSKTTANQCKPSTGEGQVKDLNENIVTIPNILTASRMALSPLLGYLVLQENFPLACGLFVFAGATDLLDGWIARNFKNQASFLGSAMDPLADKLLVSIMFISLTAVGLIPIPLTVLIVSRDIGLAAVSFYLRYISLPPPRTLSRYFDITNATAEIRPLLISKVNTALQLSLVCITLAAPVFDFVGHPYLQALWYVTAGTTVLSGLGYIFIKDTVKFLKHSTKS